MIRVCEKIKWKGRQLQEQQQKVLKRVELDRHLLIKEKMKILWDEASEEGSKSLQDLVKLKKSANMRVNKQQHAAYTSTLRKVMFDRQEIDLQPQEIKFMDMLKITIHGGWALSDEAVTEILKISGVKHMFDRIKDLERGVDSLSLGERLMQFKIDKMNGPTYR